MHNYFKLFAFSLTVPKICSKFIYITFTMPVCYDSNLFRSIVIVFQFS